MNGQPKPDANESPEARRQRPAGRDGARVEEVASIDSRIQILERRARIWSFARLISFASIVAGAAAGINAPGVASIACPIALLAFAACVRAHGRLLDQRDSLQRRRLILGERSQRLQTRRRRKKAPSVVPDGSPLERGLRIFGPEPGSQLLDPLTADDFNLLEISSPESSGGARTLFGFLDWSSTIFGSRRLRHFLLHPLADARDIVARQEAVKEAAGNSEARERIIESLIALRSHDVSPLARFLSEPAMFAGRTWLLILASILGTALPLVVLAAAVLARLELVAFAAPLAALNFALIGMHLKNSNPARDRLLLFGPLVDGLLRLDRALEEAAFASAEWRAVAGTLESLRPHASRLRRCVSLLHLHGYGVIFELWNLLTLWELRILPIAENIFTRRRKELEHAIGALGEAEALVNLALPLAEQQGFEMPWPSSSTTPVLSAEELGHPLIDPSLAVRNALTLGPMTNVLIVTGSNMSGKSTYLKSVGLNLILASAGGPVCARSFAWTPLALLSDINVRDSLDDGKSYFQVEVERVKKVLDAAKESPRVLGILDELFRGTNSEERVALARAIIRHLRSAGALLIVATHDLALTKLVTEDQEPGIENRHFRETVVGGEMQFDYRLREGPAATRNAIRVLEEQGYPEQITSEARKAAKS